MIRLQQILDRLDELAPLAIAEDWDNVGLLVGDPCCEIKSVMTCLTITAETVEEAITNEVNCVVVHHPLPFKPISQITPSTSTGKYLWQLASAKVAVYSPHTAWDNAFGGINQQLANLLALEDVQPMIPLNEKQRRFFSMNNESKSQLQLGTGRKGIATNVDTIDALVSQIRASINEPHFQCNRSVETKVSRIGIVCGSGGSFVGSAMKAGVDLLVTGEATYHQFLEATSLGIGLLTIGHYQSESFAMDRLAELLLECFSSLNIWRSRSEQDAYCGEI